MNSPTFLSNKFSALGIRGKLIGLVAAIATVSAVCLGFAVSGLLNARTKSHQSEATFKVFSAERNAYEGWLTDDDQSNMYAAFVALNNPSQHGLENTTWQQVLDGYQQANSNLSWLAAHSPTAAIRSKAAALRSDVATYNGFTQAAAINASVARNVTSSISLLAVIGIVGLILATLITIWLIRSITRPLVAMTEAAERIAEGDVDVEVEAKTNDEIGRLARAFNASIDYLKQMVGAAGQIAAGNLAVEVTPRSEHDALGRAFSDCRRRSPA